MFSKLSFIITFTVGSIIRLKLSLPVCRGETWFASAVITSQRVGARGMASAYVWHSLTLIVICVRKQWEKNMFYKICF